MKKEEPMSFCESFWLRFNGTRMTRMLRQAHFDKLCATQQNCKQLG
jgi:hypothetical protein